MIANAQDILEKFGQLPATEKKKVVSVILRESLDIETSKLSNEELTFDAENNFSETGKSKAEKFVELISEYYFFIEFREDVSKDLLFKLEQDIPRGQQNLQRLWEFYHKLILISQNTNTPEHKNSQQVLNAGFDEWLKRRKNSIENGDLDFDKESENDLRLSLFIDAKIEFKTALGKIKPNIRWHALGSRVSTYSIIYAFKQGASAEEIALRFPTLDLKQIYQVINSYLQNPNEFDDYFAEQLKQQTKRKRQIENRFSPEGIRQKLLERSQNKK